MSTDTIKRCPFCGGKSSCCYDTTEQRYKVFCNDCGIAIVPQYPDVTFMPNFNTLKETIRTWNTRKPMERIVERLEERKKCHTERYEEDCDYQELECAKSYEHAIEIVKEEGGFCD